MAIVTTHHNPFTATRDFTKVVVHDVCIKDMTPETKMPYVCILNGKPILRKDWEYRLKDQDICSFVVLPQGGGSNPLKIVAMIGVMALAWYAAPTLGTAMSGSLLSAEAATGFVASSIITAGTMLINAIIPAKTAAAAKFDTVEASPTYSISAQGNSARIGEVIPVQYGRLKCYPDFAATPYAEFNGNDQYLFELFCIGLGQYDIAGIYIEDTPITNFTEVSTQIVNPGEALTLFPASVETSTEVSGQEMKTNETLGPFVANKADTKTNRLSIDVVCARGLYSLDKKGRLNNKSLTFTVQAQAIDEYGSATGDWFTLGTHRIEAATATPQRRSFSYGVAQGRYQVKVTRTDQKDNSTTVGHEIDWSGLKAYLVDSGNVYSGMTLLAVKIKATNNISSSAAKKVNVIATRKLPIWSPSNGWSTPQATHSIAWAFADACRADYGAKLSDSQIDLQALYELDQIWTARGDVLNYRIDSKSTVWEALQAIARAGRAKPYRQAGMVRIFRDQAQTIPSGMFTMNNILKDSFSVDYAMPSDDTADAVDVEYYDEKIWQWKTVRAKMPDSTAEEPVQVKLVGVTNREQAWREGMYMVACNSLRRKTITLDTEMEGFIPTLGDLVYVSHDMVQWGQSCVARAYDDVKKILTVSEPMTWNGTVQHKIILRKPDGSVVGPIEVTAGEDAYHLVLSEAPGFPLSFGQFMEPTHISFGWDETWTQPARVLSIKPSGMFKVSIEMINEADGVHVADQNEFPKEPTHSQLPGETIRPVVTGLLARSNPGNVSTAVLSWNPAPWANTYFIEQSNDMTTWTRSGETSAPNYTCTALYGNATYFRVCAYGTAQGPWAYVAYATGAGYMWHADDTVLMWNSDETTNMWSS